MKIVKIVDAKNMITPNDVFVIIIKIKILGIITTGWIDYIDMKTHEKESYWDYSISNKIAQSLIGKEYHNQTIVNIYMWCYYIIFLIGILSIYYSFNYLSSI